jgi:HlyD family secretion protein
MTRTRTRAVALSVLAVLLVAGGVAYWRVRAGSREGAFKFETAAVDRGRVVARVTATGTLSALVTVQVGSQVSGTIASLSADFNSRVKKGQVIALIDPRLFQAAVEQARANVVAAQGNLAKARAQAADAQRQLGRTRELADRKLVAQADLDTAQTNADAAVASVTAAEGSQAQAQAGLAQASLSLAYTRIVSPTDGVVISRNVDVGQTVAASLQAPTLFVIAEDLAKMQVDTSVAEADVGRLSAGMQASFTVDAYPGQVFQGAVRQVRNAAQTVQNVVTYDAVVDVRNADLKLKPGMTATVTFVYAQRDDVVRIPNAALRFRPPPGMATTPEAGAAGAAQARRGGAAADEGAPRAPGARPAGPGGTTDAATAPTDDLRRTVWVLRDGQPAPVKVKTGISDGTVTELVHGELAPGDQAITDATGSGRTGGTSRGGGPPRIL